MFRRLINRYASLSFWYFVFKIVRRLVTQKQSAPVQKKLRKGEQITIGTRSSR
jgi:hypothetical protein